VQRRDAGGRTGFYSDPEYDAFVDLLYTVFPVIWFSV